MNNKGFAVSAVLYTLLIAFLLFLAAALAMFSSSNSLISNANSDIVNGNPFSAVRVPIARDKLIELPISRRTDQDSWGSGKVVQIKSKYGVKYWPNNFDLVYNFKTYYKNKTGGQNIINFRLPSYNKQRKIRNEILRKNDIL